MVEITLNLVMGSEMSEWMVNFLAQGSCFAEYCGILFLCSYLSFFLSFLFFVCCVVSTCDVCYEIILAS